MLGSMPVDAMTYWFQRCDQMQCEGILLDSMTYWCILKAYAMIGATNKGKQILARQVLLLIESVLASVLMDMCVKMRRCQCWEMEL